MFLVRAYLPVRSNYPQGVLIGQVRRLADEFGRPGIEAKRGQTNIAVTAKGYLNTKWPTRGMAKAYQSLIDQVWGNVVPTQRFRIVPKKLKIAPKKRGNEHSSFP